METRQQSDPVAVRDVRSLRRFNRYFTRRIGALDDQYLGQDRPLGEARLLFEIGEAAKAGGGLAA